MDDKEQEFRDELEAQAKRVNEYFPATITQEDTDKQAPNSHLKQYEWKPGQSGNPLGRPKDKKYISEALKDLLANDPDLLKQVVEAMLREVKSGNIPALKELLDRTEGKVADKIEGTENPVTIILRPARDRE